MNHSGFSVDIGMQFIINLAINKVRCTPWKVHQTLGFEKWPVNEAQQWPQVIDISYRVAQYDEQFLSICATIPLQMYYVFVWYFRNLWMTLSKFALYMKTRIILFDTHHQLCTWNKSLQKFVHKTMFWLQLQCSTIS